MINMIIINIMNNITNWWKNAIGYQIYIKSFYDSNNDGIGDLNGITLKLSYIKDLGVNFIWICPFYDSPMDDNGYDIRNYYKVDKIYGTINDLKLLIDKAHNFDIKVIIDLVLNHTSDEHEWFIKSENKIEPYTDFYIWKDDKKKRNKLLPPNNWQSFFSGSAWKFSEKRKQYYLKLFSNKMPDINYENEIVFTEIENIIKFYATLGIDGFRVDAIAHIGKDLSFKNAKNAKKSYKHFSNLPKTHEYLKIMNKIFNKYKMVTMGELGGNPTKKDLLMYTTENELDLIFSFEHLKIFNKNHTINKNKLLKLLNFKNSICVNGGHSALFWLNHDYPRLVSKIKNEQDPLNAQLCLATLMYFLKGTPIIYNGEEIGMCNYPFNTPKDFKDVNAKMMFDNSKNINKTLQHLKDNSRDNSRTIMQWSDETNAGFTKATPWTYVNSNYKELNVTNQSLNKNSMLSNYKKLISLRKELSNIINNGYFEFFYKNNMLGYFIKTDNAKYIIQANLSKKEIPLKYDIKTLLYTNITIQNNILKPYCVIIAKLNNI